MGDGLDRKVWGGRGRGSYWQGGGIDGGDLGVHGGQGGGHGFGGREVGGEAEMGEEGAESVRGGGFCGFGVACLEAVGELFEGSSKLDELSASVVVLGLGGEGFALDQHGGGGFRGRYGRARSREQGARRGRAFSARRGCGATPGPAAAEGGLEVARGDRGSGRKSV